jgi:hypothetical protein
MFLRTLFCALGAVWLLSPDALGEEAVAPDWTKRAAPNDGVAMQKESKFRRSWLILDNAVNTQTVGVGSDYQSSNPTYEMSLSLRPRYYFHTTPQHELYLSGRADVIREITNSDVTTRDGETTLSDITLFAAHKWKLVEGSTDTWLLTYLPVLTFPTSNFSQNNGTILGLGARFWFNQTFKLAGESWPVFKRAHVGAITAVNYTFSEATTATNPAIRRVRLEPDGKTYPGDQLTGSAFPHTEVTLQALFIAEITETIALWLDAAYRPTWLYGFSPADVCTQTGCAPVQPSQAQAPTTYVPTTSFGANLYFDVIPELTLGAGYTNLALQVAPDGQRRSIFNSPSAQFHFVVWAHLDALYLTAIGHRPSALIHD